MPPLAGAQNERSPENAEIPGSIFGPAQTVKYTRIAAMNANVGNRVTMV